MAQIADVHKGPQLAAPRPCFFETPEYSGLFLLDPDG